MCHRRYELGNAAQGRPFSKLRWHVKTGSAAGFRLMGPRNNKNSGSFLSGGINTYSGTCTATRYFVCGTSPRRMRVTPEQPNIPLLKIAKLRHNKTNNILNGGWPTRTSESLLFVEGIIRDSSSSVECTSSAPRENPACSQNPDIPVNFNEPWRRLSPTTALEACTVVSLPPGKVVALSWFLIPVGCSGIFCLTGLSAYSFGKLLWYQT